MKVKYKNISPELLNKLYWVDELSHQNIALKLEVPRSHIGNLLKKYNIPRRSRSDAAILGHKNWPHRAELAFRWRGGHSITPDGYIVTRLKPAEDFFHPMCWKSRKRNCHDVPEHRLVMAKYIGRCLLPTEQVHHINGLKTDNRIENLRLLSAIKTHRKLHPTVVCPHCQKQFVLVNGQPINAFL